MIGGIGHLRGLPGSLSPGIYRVAHSDLSTPAGQLLLVAGFNAADAAALAIDIADDVRGQLIGAVTPWDPEGGDALPGDGGITGEEHRAAALQQGVDLLEPLRRKALPQGCHGRWGGVHRQDRFFAFIHQWAQPAIVDIAARRTGRKGIAALRRGGLAVLFPLANDKNAQQHPAQRQQQNDMYPQHPAGQRISHTHRRKRAPR